MLLFQSLSLKEITGWTDIEPRQVRTRNLLTLLIIIYSLILKKM